MRSFARASPGKALLSTRSYIDQMDCGLTSAQGAQEIISMITSRRIVTKLILGHNSLGDEGTRVLFVFLCSAAGRKYRITEISLNSNEIGDPGLAAIADCLKSDLYLKELFLQNNNFTGNMEVIRSFASSLNHSRLETLSLTTNPFLLDSFSWTFFSVLDSTCLRELHISSMRLTVDSVEPIIEYITSPRCRLHVFKCNGNTLGYRGVSSIVDAIDKANYTLLNVELFSNHSPNADDEGSQTERDATQSLLRQLLSRNQHLQRQTTTEAVALLHYSRAMLLRPSAIIPTEIQLYILSFFAPSLSETQRLRVYEYASTAKTLPRLLPTLHSLDGPACLPDPAAVANIWRFQSPRHPSSSCSSCPGSLLCHKGQTRQRWLDAVGCSFFDPGSTLT